MREPDVCLVRRDRIRCDASLLANRFLAESRLPNKNGFISRERGVAGVADTVAPARGERRHPPAQQNDGTEPCRPRLQRRTYEGDFFAQPTLRYQLGNRGEKRAAR